MADIVEFLEAQYANEAKQWQTIWRFKQGDRRVDGWWDLGGTFGGLVHSLTDTTRGGRDLAAKRRRLERHRSYDFPFNPDDGPGDYAWTPVCNACHEPWPCFDLRNDASPYADRPGFRPEWNLDDSPAAD